MGVRGPLPNASNVHQLPGAGAAPAPEPPRPRPTMPAQPPGMTPKAKTVWKRLAEPLNEAGLLTAVDGFTLALLCEHYVTAREARGQLDRLGPTIKDRAHGGMPKKNPAAQVFRDNSEAFLKLAQELGLSPKARMRMAAPAAASEPSDEVGIFDA